MQGTTEITCPNKVHMRISQSRLLLFISRLCDFQQVNVLQIKTA